MRCKGEAVHHIGLRRTATDAVRLIKFATSVFRSSPTTRVVTDRSRGLTADRGTRSVAGFRYTILLFVDKEEFSGS